MDRIVRSVFLEKSGCDWNHVIDSIVKMLDEDEEDSSEY